jgi:hypothetical protein
MGFRRAGIRPSRNARDLGWPSVMTARCKNPRRSPLKGGDLRGFQGRATQPQWLGTRAPGRDPPRGGLPPGTVRAPLDAYGSTSDTTEMGAFSEANLGLPLDGCRWHLRHRPSEKLPVRGGCKTATKARLPSQQPCALAMKIWRCEWRTVFSARRGGPGFIGVNGLPHRQHACRP